MFSRSLNYVLFRGDNVMYTRVSMFLLTTLINYKIKGFLN